MVRSDHGHEMLPAACSWIFPTVGIGFLLLYSRGASDEVKKDVMTSINNYLLTKTFPVGVRGCVDEVDGNVCDLRAQHNYASAAPGQYEQVHASRRNTDKFAELLGYCRRKKRKKTNLRLILNQRKKKSPKKEKKRIRRR